MADTDFYNLNLNRKYPLVTPPTNRYILTGSVEVFDEFLVDCGFTLGPAMQYEPGLHTMYLDSITRSGDNLYIRFKTDTAHTFEFVRYKDAPSGKTTYSEASGNPLLGVGFLVSGDIRSVYDQMTEGQVATKPVVDDPVYIEPALVVSEYRHAMTSLNVGNLPKVSPDACCTDPSPIDEETVEMVASGLTGGIVFKAGYNMRVGVSAEDDTITLTPSSGEGEGIYCDDEQPEGVKCGDLIYSINGILPSDNGAATIVVSNGFKIEPDPDAHTIAIISKLETEVICEEGE